MYLVADLQGLAACTRPACVHLASVGDEGAVGEVVVGEVEAHVGIQQQAQRVAWVHLLLEGDRYRLHGEVRAA